MITKKELEISNESYTRKDFYQIYPEILDLVTKITERWSPESSNESDPGVVLLKLLAFIADKNNYNIDKNVLECFMPSATQEESMRKLCDMMGYEMKYYNSAQTDLSFTWLGDKEAGDTFSFTLPKYRTTIQNKEGDVTYTLIEDITFDKDQLNKTQVKNAIQGEVIKLSIGESDVIVLENIDDKYRVYLPESSVAQNGIFIEFADPAKSSRVWRQTNNLNIELPGTYRWKFGFDSLKRLPYIQFPDDISALIEDGLNIWYTRTTGANGNVSTNVLTKLTSKKEQYDEDLDKTITIITDSAEGTVNLIITNKSATIDGHNPETIDEAYNGFKKTVGTFNTLVTCRDYANAIYNMVSGSSPLVSNCQVGDIRTDVFRSSTVKSFNVYGEVSFDIPERDNSDKDRINNFDLYLYPLTRISNAYTPTSYNNSFRADTNNIGAIKSNLEEFKTIAHQFAFPARNELYLIKNYYKLAGNITTTYKVNMSEATDILTNVYEELYKNFNSRKLDYGRAIDPDIIFSVIKNSDYRIKNVDLRTPELDTKFMLTDGTEYDSSENDDSGLTGYENCYIKMLSKNILAGRLPLFKYDNSFDTGFDRKQYIPAGSSESVGPIIGDDSDVAKQIYTLSTSFALPLDAIGSGYKLNDNEIIQFRAPNLRTSIIYPYQVNYAMTFGNPGTASDPTTIKANEEYLLKDNDILYIEYSDADDDSTQSEHWIKYYKDGSKWYEKDNGDIKEFSGIIRFNFEVRDIQYNTRIGRTEGIPDDWTGITKLVTLGAKEQIEIRDFVRAVFSGETNQETQTTKFKKFFWLTETGYLFDDGATSKTLSESEYLFYTNDAETELYAFGSGTLITTSLSAELAHNKYYINYNNNKKVSVDEVSNYGLSAFDDVTWKTIIFGTNETLTCQEMQFITLAKGDTIKEITDYPQAKLDNTFRNITTARYIMDGKESSLPALSWPDAWQVRSRFDVNCSSDKTQAIYLYDSIKAYNKDNDELAELSVDESDPDNFPIISANYSLLEQGNDVISARILNIVFEEINDLKLLVFSEADQINQDIDMYNYDYTYTKANLDDLSTDDKFYVLIPDVNKAAIMMIHYAAGEEDSAYVKSSTNTLLKYTDITSMTGSLSLTNSIQLKNGINIIYIEKSATYNDIYFDSTASESGAIKGTVVFGRYNIIAKDHRGINIDLFGFKGSAGKINIQCEALLAYLLEYGSVLRDNTPESVFYYNYPIKDQEAIDITSKTLDETFWFDVNNVASKFVLSELDTAELSNITIAKQSRRF